MAKVSNKSITDISQDWGNDGEGLPYSGKEVQKIIKSELANKVANEDLEVKVKSQLKSQLFGDGASKLITEIEGNSEALTISSIDSEGKTTTSSINIGTPDVNDRFIKITTQLSKQYINVGGEIKIGFGFVVTDYQNALITPSYANVSMSIARQGSSNPFYKVSLGTVENAVNEQTTNHEVDLTSIIANNITGSSSVVISLAVEYTYEYNEDGVQKTKTITKYSSIILTVLSLTLTTNVNITGVGGDSQVSIPYTVRGNGNKTVYLYKNGVLVSQHDNITSASSSNVFIQTLNTGLNNFQLVAETSAGDTTVRSSSFYFDLFNTTVEPVIALLIEDSTGSIQEGTTYKAPVFNAAKFSDFAFKYYMYDTKTSITQISITTDELNADSQIIVSSTSEQTLNRKLYTYSKKIKSSNQLKITFKSESINRVLYINPMASSINIELPTEGLKLNLDADGRSNEEANPSVWKYGNIDTVFENFNWQSNGWIDNSLVLKNGAKATINFPLFQAVNNYPVTRNGCTFEILFKCSNATLEENDVIKCYWEIGDSEKRKVGLNITTRYAGVNTGEVTEYKDDDGKTTQSVITQVGSLYAQDEWYKFTFVINPEAHGIGSDKGLCFGFLNGILSYIAPLPSSFINLDKLPIIVDSKYADVYIKSIKYYDRPLTFDQCVDEYIIDQSTAVLIESLYQKNDILSLDDVGQKYIISPAKLKAKGRGVMIISPSKSQTNRQSLQDLNTSSDKKAYYGPFRIDYYAPASDLNLGYTTIPTKGSSFDYVHKECAIRIQGTTSTKRPRKNYRLHYDKKDKNNKPSENSFIIGGNPTGTDFKYRMSQDAVAVPITCLKTDYVDSSMTHNTGGAVIFNELTKNIESLRNPAQKREFKSSVTDIKTRVAVEGFPIDVFASDGLSSSTDDGDYREVLEDSRYTNLVYMGQYNFNNDKSKSGKVFGFDGSYKYDADGTYNENGEYEPICVEFLDNNAKLDLFQVTFDSSNNIDEATTYSSEAFGNALEVRAPADVTDQVADNGLDSLATTPEFSQYSFVPSQLKRIFNFIGLCAKQVAENNNKEAKDLNTMSSEDLEKLDWTSIKFAKEAPDYFNLSSILAWYIWTDYLIAVDQRAKNMMLYTMDGKHWMFQYYDGDTMLGERNDCFLAYDYLTDRTTWDDGVKQYAMQGHDSWLWYLVRANYSVHNIESNDPQIVTNTAVNLSSICKLMRDSGKFSASYFNQILNGQFVDNWSERQYNYSQEYKYIKPLSDKDDGISYPSDISTNFISTAQGSREAHRTYTLNNRFPLLDSKYQAGTYSQDSFVYYAAAGNKNKLTIISSIPYYFGWNTSNTSIREHQAATEKNNYTVVLNIEGNAANNPANVLGASRIKELTFSSTSAWTVDSSKDVKLPNLQKLIAKDMGNKAVGDLYLTNCPLLTTLDLSGSNFSSLNGIENCNKMLSINVENTGIKALHVADGCPINTLKASAPTELYLSNLENLVFEDKNTDTLTAQQWTSLNKLLLNNCPKINKEKLLAKFLNSTATIKYLRITGINEENSITWLDQFTNIYGLDENGLEVTTGAQLVGTLTLLDYTDDEIVANYQAKFPSLIIKQPEYTLIVTDEAVTDETGFTYDTVGVGSTTNLDNNTGYGTGKKYQPSGHILNILNRVHRYLGKLINPGNATTIEGFPTDPTPKYRTLPTRDMTGTMMLIQLADSNSTYFNTGYDKVSTRREANLDGKQGHGEVYVKIPGFWYKGINYNPVTEENASKRYTCYSSYEEKPSTSDEIRSISIEDLRKLEVTDNDTDEGLYKQDFILINSNEANSLKDRLSSRNGFDIFRIKVNGYKKIMYPSVTGITCCLFTDENNKIITNLSGSVVNYGELYSSSSLYKYSGMPVLANIPVEAKYFYIVIPKYIDTVNKRTTTDPCNIILHKGSKFSSGEEMTDKNAQDWIADMEPDWVYSDPVCIAASECVSDDYINLYTSFNGTKNICAVGSQNTDIELDTIGDWTQYSLSRAAYNRGLQLIDYEATKLLANLFIAKYGRRNFQNQLGGGTATSQRPLGVTRMYGVQDTVVPKNPSLTSEGVYNNAVIVDTSTEKQVTVQSNNFLGIENVSGNIYEYLDRTFLVNDTYDNLNKIRVTNPDLTTRRIYARADGNYIMSVKHGKYCDITNCSSGKGGTTIGYSDYAYYGVSSSLYTKMSDVRSILRSGRIANAEGGVFFLYGGISVGFSSVYYGSRLLFRGNIIEITDIDKFLSENEWRG